MTHPFFAVFILALVTAGCQTTPDNTSTSPRNPWRTLFDGSSTAGWEMVGPGELRLENGQLVTHGGMGMLWYSREKFGDCQIRVVFKTTKPEDNSGVFIRFPNRPADPMQAVNEGFEVQIANSGDDWHRTGTLYSLTRARDPLPALAKEWNTLLITLDGKRTRAELNGVLITDYTDGDPVPPKKIWYEPDRGPRPDYGFIGLQNHDESSRVSFKEVAIRHLRP